jgi:hypothetical protein
MTDTLRGDTTAAIDFLKQWRATGPWQLTAIQKDEDRIETRTFCPSDEDEAPRMDRGASRKHESLFHGQSAASRSIPQ